MLILEFEDQVIHNIIINSLPCRIHSSTFTIRKIYSFKHYYFYVTNAGFVPVSGWQNFKKNVHKTVHLKKKLTNRTIFEKNVQFLKKRTFSRKNRTNKYIFLFYH